MPHRHRIWIWGAFALTAASLSSACRTTVLADNSASSVPVASAQPATLGSELVFCREGGLAFAEAASDFTHIRRAAEAAAKRQGRPFHRFRFHDLRHLFAVTALRGGMGLYDLQQHLGHTSVKTTEIYLAFLTPDEQMRAKAAPASPTAQKSAQLRRSVTTKSAERLEK